MVVFNVKNTNAAGKVDVTFGSDLINHLLKDTEEVEVFPDEELQKAVFLMSFSRVSHVLICEF